MEVLVMPKYPFDWTKFWEWRNAQPITAKDIKKRNDDYWKSIQLSPISLKRIEAWYGSWQT